MAIKGTVRTQGTELYTVDALTSSVATVLKFACPTGITGLGGAADQIDDTCLDDMVDRTFSRGLGNPGQISVPFNFIPENGSHQILFDLQEAGETLPWLIGLSDGYGIVPTLDTDDTLIPTNGRTWIGFDAYIADVNLDIATNEVVRGTLTLQRSGPVRPSWTGPYAA